MIDSRTELTTPSAPNSFQRRPVRDVAVIGAGPYGLSIAAHLRARGADFQVFGTPMSTWRSGMPKGMFLKSDGFASSLSAPEPDSSLADYCRDHDLEFHPTDLPVPLQTFVDYASDFQRRFVPDLDERHVTSVVPDGRLYRLTLDDGEELDARNVVVAAGITHFAVMPETFTDLPTDRVTHSSAHHDLEEFADRDVTVIGAGSSAVDLAVALSAVGARARLVARGSAIRFSSHGTFGDGRPNLASRVRKPPSGLGPGWRSRLCCDVPDLFRYLPAGWRPEIVRRHLGPSSPWHLQGPLESSVEVLTGHTVRRADVNGKVALELEDGIGARTTTIESDHVICATGYRADIDRLAFLDPSLRAGIKTVAQAPVLSHRFESSVPGVYFAGIAAAVTFGPLMRFMYGDDFAAKRIASHLAGSPS